MFRTAAFVIAGVFIALATEGRSARVTVSVLPDEAAAQSPTIDRAVRTATDAASQLATA